MPTRLKEEQDKLIIRLRKERKGWKTDLERVMVHQHARRKTNLLDFAGDLNVALFFACFDRKNRDSDGRVIVKGRDKFCKLDNNATLPDDEIILLQPPKSLLIARDQRAVLLNSPNGIVQFKEEDAVLIKSELKEEILELLEKVYNVSYPIIYGNLEKPIPQLYGEGERVAGTLQSTEGPAMPKHDKDILTMDYYMKLLAYPVIGPYKKLLMDYAEKLIESFTNTIRLNPVDSETHYSRAFIHQSKPNPDYEQAILDYDRAIELNPDYAKAYNNRGIIYAKAPIRDYDRAISDFNRAIDLNPTLATAYNNRGSIYANKKPPDYEQAVRDYSQAIELDDSFAIAYHNRSITCVAQPNPDYARARSDHIRVLELNPGLVWRDRDQTPKDQVVRGLSVWADKHSQRAPKFMKSFIDCYSRVCGWFVIGRKKPKS